MIYEKPIYVKNLAEAKDVITLSKDVSNVMIVEITEDEAEVSVSANDVLG